jgi:hypothetical protein
VGAGAVAKWGIKVSEVTSCKAVSNYKIFEALNCLTLHYLIYNNIL